jgi:hypothetical protein
VIHHVADSHMHSNIRMRLALTADAPAIMAYPEGLWAEFPDARNAPVEQSLLLLENLHHRWVVLLKSLPDSDYERSFRHPELGPVRLDTIWRSTPGVGGITRRTSPVCGTAWAGSRGLGGRSSPAAALSHNPSAPCRVQPDRAILYNGSSVPGVSFTYEQPH